MTPELERFAKTNPGFKQFQTRYRHAIATPDVIDEVRRYESERMRQAGMIEAALLEGEEKGEEKGKKKGEKKLNLLNSALAAANRIPDLLRAIDDVDYRETLYKEFNL